MASLNCWGQAHGYAKTNEPFTSISYSSDVKGVELPKLDLANSYTVHIFYRLLLENRVADLAEVQNNYLTELGFSSVLSSSIL